jgi:hypothetical protein
MLQDLMRPKGGFIPVPNQEAGSTLLSSAARHPFSSPAVEKSQSPFTFELKRSRLPSGKTSTFQSYVIAPVGSVLQSEQDASAPQASKQTIPLPCAQKDEFF